jgi:hypothetical protein
MDFVYLYERTKKSLAIALSGKEGAEGERGGGNVNNVQYKSNQIVTMNPPTIMQIS